MSSVPPYNSFLDGHISSSLPRRPLLHQFLPSSSTTTSTMAANDVTPAEKVEHLKFASRHHLMGEYCWGLSTLLCLSDAWIRGRIFARQELEHPMRLISPIELVKNNPGTNDQASSQNNENHFGLYSREQLTEEHCWGVSTRLCLSDPWIVKKILRTSDLQHPTRLLLPANVTTIPDSPFSSDNFPHRLRPLGVRVTIFDSDIQTHHRFDLKRCSFDPCYALVGAWRSEFVERRNLKLGDEIGLYWDSARKFKFIFSVLRRATLSST